MMASLHNPKSPCSGASYISVWPEWMKGLAGCDGDREDPLEAIGSTATAMRLDPDGIWNMTWSNQVRVRPPRIIRSREAFRRVRRAPKLPTGGAIESSPSMAPSRCPIRLHNRRVSVLMMVLTDSSGRWRWLPVAPE